MKKYKFSLAAFFHSIQDCFIENPHSLQSDLRKRTICDDTSIILFHVLISSSIFIPVGATDGYIKYNFLFLFNFVFTVFVFNSFLFCVSLPTTTNHHNQQILSISREKKIMWEGTFWNELSEITTFHSQLKYFNFFIENWK